MLRDKRTGTALCTGHPAARQRPEVSLGRAGCDDVLGAGHSGQAGQLRQPELRRALEAPAQLPRAQSPDVKRALGKGLVSSEACSEAVQRSAQYLGSLAKGFCFSAPAARTPSSHCRPAP